MVPPKSPGLPFPISPMKGAAGDLPHGDGWVYELKWDGMRIIAHIGRSGHRDPESGPDPGSGSGFDDRPEPVGGKPVGELRLQSSNGRDVSASFPELEALATLGDGYDGLILDGEVVAFAGGQPNFNALQHRVHVGDRAEAARRAVRVPVIFVAFDLLWLDGHDTTALALRHRRALLEQVVEPGPSWRICEQHDDRADELIAAVIDAKLEGIVAKRTDSPYLPGRRSSNWIKVKPRRRQEFVVGGWLSGRGSRTGHLGSLLVGCYDGDDLHFAGRAGSGLTDSTSTEWEAALTETAVCPFAEVPTVALDGRDLHWCVPDQVVEVAFAEWADGRQLRHPVVLGRRFDKDPIEVVRER